MCCGWGCGELIDAVLLRVLERETVSDPIELLLISLIE